MKFDEKVWLDRKDEISRMCDLGFTVTHMAAHYRASIPVMASVLTGLGLQTLAARLREAQRKERGNERS